MNKGVKTKLVKMDSDLYNKVKEHVSQNKVEHPSIKNFVEKSVLKSLSLPQDLNLNSNNSNEKTKLNDQLKSIKPSSHHYIG